MSSSTSIKFNMKNSCVTFFLLVFLVLLLFTWNQQQRQNMTMMQSRDADPMLLTLHIKPIHWHPFFLLTHDISGNHGNQEKQLFFFSFCSFWSVYVAWNEWPSRLSCGISFFQKKRKILYAQLHIQVWLSSKWAVDSTMFLSGVVYGMENLFLSFYFSPIFSMFWVLVFVFHGVEMILCLFAPVL